MATTAAKDRLNKPLLFETKDVMGSVVICARSAWESHITTGHPEMIGREIDVQAAIASPDEILLSTSNPNALIHQKITSDLVQIRVVTTYDEIDRFASGTSIAKVNTAFPVQPEDYPSPHVGVVIYSRSASGTTAMASNPKGGNS